MVSPAKIAGDEKLKRFFKKAEHNKSSHERTPFNDVIMRSVAILRFIMNEENMDTITKYCDEFYDTFFSCLEDLIVNNGIEQKSTFILCVEYILMKKPKIVIGKILNSTFLSYFVNNVNMPQVSNFVVNF